MGKKIQAKIQELEQKNSELINHNKDLSSEISSLKLAHEETLTTKNSEWENKYKQFEELKNDEILNLNKQVSERDELIKQKNLELDKKELKKLAQAYDEQEGKYNDTVKFWLKCLFYSGALLSVSATASVVFSSGEVWYQKFEYYLADIVLFSAVWFCASNYSDSVKLKNDYANRKTLAQSFSNILHNLPDDEIIKNKFIEKATDVLCAPSLISNKEHVLSKEAVKQIIEVGKMISNK